MTEIRAATVLPARREDITLRTDDGLSLVGEIARPLSRDPVAPCCACIPCPPRAG